jgi:uroporphyrinogen decarboxylase
MNDVFLRACRKEKTPYTPIWLMRQAGRYLPEYRALREKAKNFWTLCTTPHLSTEITLQPLRRFPLDAAILFSDILVLPKAMGFDIQFVENEGPVITNPWQGLGLGSIDIPPLQAMDFVFETIDRVKKELDVPLIGFGGSPYTMASYLIEGKSGTDFCKTRTLMYTQPANFESFLSLLSDALSLYLVAQIESGANAIMIFDTWGGNLTPETYERFSLAFIKETIGSIRARHPHIPVILFTKGGGLWLEAQAKSGANVIGLDWHTDIGEARAKIGAETALQGNLDPAVLFGSKAVIEAEVKKTLSHFGAGSGHIFNLGHGVIKTTPVDAVAHLIATVHQESAFFH